jgi:outer membrane protein assembly factor BamB
MKWMISLVLCCVCLTGHGQEASMASGYRGPHRTGIFPGSDLLSSWPEGGPPKLWEADVGTGWAAPSVANGVVYFVGVTKTNQGQVHAFSLDGKELFRSEYGPEKPGQAPRTTPTIADGRLFYESNLGILHCLDAKTGATLWTANINDLGDTSAVVDGVSGSPLVYRGMAIVSSRCKTNDDPSLVAFDVKTGKLAWKGNFGICPESGKTWSSDHQSPILVDTGKTRLAINGYFRCVGAVNADTGEKVWNLLLNDPSRKLGRNQPLFNEGYLFLGGTLMQKLQPDGSFQDLWHGKIRVPEYNVSYSHTIIRDGRLIAFVPPSLTCLDAATGAVINSLPCGAQGSIVMADDKVILFDNRPLVSLIAVSKDGLKEISSFKPPIGAGRNDNFTHPAVADGRLILRKLNRVVVYDLRPGK